MLYCSWKFSGRRPTMSGIYILPQLKAVLTLVFDAYAIRKASCLAPTAYEK